jgi:tRNA A-37 threonylcarbamoyl transferase component Bud32
MTEPADPSTPVIKELTGRIGRYEIARSLGKGAMGQVYLAHDTVLDRDVALKVMAAQVADDPELKTRFEREARAAAKLKHRNVVTVFDLGNLPDGSPYIAMEYLEGKDLQKSMRQTPSMTLERKVAIIVQVLSGLAAAHDKDIVHRDIKPANIFIQEDGSVKIMDFGVARLTTASMTGTGNIVGTADYMSPEQVRGEKVEPRSDLFSVGCMLFELVTGRRPFHADNLMAIFYKITHDEANFDLIPQGAEYDALMPILRKALARDQYQRYQTAFDFAVDLREWLRAHATTASSQHVLESLVDLEAPAHPPGPMTEAPGVPLEWAETGPTVDLGQGRRRGPPGRGTLTPVRVGGRTAVDSAAGATMRPGTTRVITPPPVVRPRPRPVQRRSPLPWVGLAALIAAVGAGGYVYWQRQQEVRWPTPQAAAPPVTQAPPTTVATPTPPPVTAAPQPTFAEAEGKGATQVRAAQSAFNAGSYDKAVAAAQGALREDPSNRGAQDVLDRAMKGQEALTRLRAAEAALARGDFATAESEAEAARQLAAWDRSVAGFFSRLSEARVRAQLEAETRVKQQRATQITGLLNQGASALQNKQYEAAMAAYDQVLALDPGNTAAQTGKQAAIGAKTMAEAAASSGRTGGVVRTFVAGATEAKGTEQSGLVGFEDSAGVKVHKGTQATELPGKILFEATPSSPKPGDRLNVSAFLMNEGSQPIQLASMVIAYTVDGRTQRNPVPPLATTVAPRDRALVFQARDQLWKEGTTSWSLEVTLSTGNRESYRNTLSWK